MDRLLARKKLLASLRRKRSESGLSSTPSDQKPREDKSAPYRNPQYELVLNTKGIFMKEPKEDIGGASKLLCQKLLNGEQDDPNKSVFDDAVFRNACQNLQGKKEARVIQDISRLVVPWAETLALRVECLVESSFFMAIYYMLFPFLSNEVQCGVQALDVADRQNAHSMALTARGIVEVFRLVKREKELHRELLAFSVSHDHCSMRVYGCYPVIGGKDTKHYRHPIHKFDFTTIRSAIGQLPSNLDFDVPSLPDTGLSQRLARHYLSQPDPASMSKEDDGQSSIADQHRITPDTSFTGPGAAKRPRRKTGSSKQPRGCNQKE
ncbi:hypothetical protein B0T24DRAFT_658999 [Lasiosphaeria ovina]|uniref:DUF7924 domain-containing protein n=1 Tax=Lasiosphaeria ovina TaxID=92902 RepID=A0AAE0N0Z3_9PEZI|nr:hypothetical protein B0T24DRAFT_658999 [Lasiosphaeria ovina]